MKEVSADNCHKLPVTKTDNPDPELSSENVINNKTPASSEQNQTKTTTQDYNPTKQRTTKLTQKVSDVTKSIRQKKQPPEIKQLSATLQLDKLKRVPSHPTSI